ncbi:fido domain-containing protein [Mycena vitilis]|nr:fido domain-containing protein [Mycena vitilis]
MATARFCGSHYVPPGDTRTVTRNTVFVNTPTGRVKFCPYTAVDSELVVICQSAKAYMDKNTNPFAVASWLHLILARCHPFDVCARKYSRRTYNPQDGNGRVTRLVASIPLLRAGYPPISISLDQRSDYLQAINKVYDGEHGPFMQCIFDGMLATIERVEQLKV